MLEALVAADLGDVCAGVVRYLGGVLRGAGGLTRAYRAAVADAVAISSIVRREPRELVAAELDYAQAHALSSESTRRAWAIETAYGERVTVTVAVPSSQVDDVEHLISNLTSGNTRGVRRGTRWVDLPS